MFTNLLTVIGLSLSSATMQTPQISQEVRSGIVLMREEEKFARDVYAVLSEKWGRPFSNIKLSEETHFAATKGLLTRYGVEDPCINKKPGEFTNPTLTKLYLEHTKAGAKSKSEALKVGASIEELDIFDLNRLLGTTLPTDVRNVYENLVKGSRNHLRAFASSLKALGVEYKPQYLSQKAYTDIVSTPRERGRGG